jgi:hypothetical protein
MISGLVGDDYLSDKIKKVKDGSDAIELGKGAYGTVRFALNIFKSEANPGEIICIKKT